MTTWRHFTLQGIILDFFKQNIIYIGLAIGSGLSLIWPMLNRGAIGVANISPTEAVVLMNRAKPLILDVRNEDEFDAGHIQGAKHIPITELSNRMKEIEKFKDKPVLVHCQKGPRAKSACAILREAHFTQIHNLEGGLVSWIEAKMPVVKE